MRIFLLLVLVSVCALVNGQKIIHIDTSENRYVSPKGYRNPELMFKNFSATTYNGIPYTTDSLKGKTTFVNFWYEGCLPCLAEFDALNDLYDLYKNNPLFQFLSFTSESKENALRVADKFKLKYPVICIEKDDIYNMIFGNEWVFISTYQDMGYIRDGKMVILAPQQKIEMVRPDFLTGANTLIKPSDSLVNEAIAWYQGASFLYGSGRYKRVK